MLRTFTTGATRDSEVGKLDFEACLSPAVLERYAQFCHAHAKLANGELRPVDNWQKGMPREVYAKSLLRHVWQVWKLNRGLETKNEKGEVVTIENALCAVIFNAQGFLFEELKARESKPKRRRKKGVDD